MYRFYSRDKMLQLLKHSPKAKGLSFKLGVGVSPEGEDPQ